MKSDRDVLPLVQAAAKAAVGYLVMRDLVMRQRVRGWQDPASKRWFVSRSDLRRYIRDRAKAQPVEVA